MNVGRPATRGGTIGQLPPRNFHRDSNKLHHFVPPLRKYQMVAALNVGIVSAVAIYIHEKSLYSKISVHFISRHYAQRIELIWSYNWGSTCTLVDLTAFWQAKFSKNEIVITTNTQTDFDHTCKKHIWWYPWKMCKKWKRFKKNSFSQATQRYLV